MIWLIVSGLVLGLAGLLVYVYYLFQGQFTDQENVKYQLFHEDEGN